MRAISAALLLVLLTGCASVASPADPAAELEAAVAQVPGVTSVTAHVSDHVTVEAGIAVADLNGFIAAADGIVAAAATDLPLGVSFSMNDIHGAAVGLDWEGFTPSARDRFIAASQLWYEITQDPLVDIAAITLTSDAVSAIAYADASLDAVGLQAGYTARLVTAGYAADRISLTVTPR